MKSKGPPATDLLVCFPTRAHLSLMAPKPISSSPARLPESSTRHNRRPMSKSSINRGGHGSPWAAKHKSEDVSEPTSPKVTCAGQIKVRAKPDCKNWQSVMEEIERLHKNKKKGSWIEALGFKKEVTQFLTCLRNLRFDFRCFGSGPGSEIISEDEDEDEDEDDRNGNDDDDKSSRAVFSKWFMILQEDNVGVKDEDKAGEAAPPRNALLLMRCRSAPAKSWLEEREEEERCEVGKEGEGKEDSGFSPPSNSATSSTVIASFGGEISAGEVRVMAEIQEKIIRSRSWKR